MVKIRLSRLGKTNRPYWRIVALDSRKKRDGAFLDNLGSYDPLKHEVTQIHLDRIQEWVSKGAICSDTVKKLIKTYKSTEISGKEPKIKKEVKTKKAEAKVEKKALPKEEKAEKVEKPVEEKVEENKA